MSEAKTKEKKSGPGKGNWTRGKDRRGGMISKEAASKYPAALGEMTEYYREIARTRENVIKYNQKFVSVLADRISNYIEEQQSKRQPLTVSGMVKASGMNPDAYRKAREGEYDHLLFQYMDFNGIDFNREGTEFTDPETGETVLLCRMSWPIKMGDLAITEEREVKCSSLKGNPAGNIFLLKAQQGFRDDPGQTTNNNTLVMNIASIDEARDALKRLQSE